MLPTLASLLQSAHPNPNGVLNTLVRFWDMRAVCRFFYNYRNLSLRKNQCRQGSQLGLLVPLAACLFLSFVKAPEDLGSCKADRSPHSA